MGPTLISEILRHGIDDCDHCPDDWKHQTELARVHLVALLVDCDDFLSQAQEETEEVMSLVKTSVPVLSSCLPLLGYLGAHWLLVSI